MKQPGVPGLNGFVKAKVTLSSTFAGLVAFVSTVAALEYLWDKFFLASKGVEPLIWAISVTLGLFMFGGLASYCVYAQSTLLDELERVVQVKIRLENLVLQRRLSSRNNEPR